MINEEKPFSNPNEKLYRARHDRHWSIDRAADEIGVSRTTYIRWEQGTQIPHDSSLVLICDAFKMSAEQLGFSKSAGTPPTASLMQSPTAYLMGNESNALVVDMFSTGMLALTLAQRQYGWTFEELQARTAQEMRRLDSMAKEQTGQNISRREAVQGVLSFLVGLPIAVAGLTTARNQNLLPPEEVIPLYTTAIPACWRLFFDGELSEVERVLPNYLSHLTTLARQDSKYQKSVAGLASQAYQLNALFVLQREDFGSSLAQAKQASLYGRLADDPNLQVSSAIRQVDTLFHRNTLLQHSTFLRHKNYLQILGVLQEAEQHIQSISPLLRGRIFSELGVAYANTGQQKEAERYIGLAHDTYPDRPEDDPGFLYTHTNHYIPHIDDMLARLSLGQPKDAWRAITKASIFVPNTVSPRRMELLDYYVIGSIALNDLESSCAYFEELALSSSQLGSDLHSEEVQTIYHQLFSKWPQEKRVQELAELLPSPDKMVAK